MRRSIWLSLLISLMFASMGAASASAAAFHAETKPEFLLGQQVESTKFRFPSTHFGEFFLEPICAKGEANGETASFTVEAIQLVPTYSSCTTQLVPITVEANGCGYSVTATGSGGSFGANLKLTCPAGKQIIFRFFAGPEICRIMIGAQTPASSSFELVNEGSPQDVRLVGTATGLKYTTFPNNNTTGCGENGVNAELVLNLAIKGYSDAARTKQVSFRVE